MEYVSSLNMLPQHCKGVCNLSMLRLVHIVFGNAYTYYIPLHFGFELSIYIYILKWALGQQQSPNGAFNPLYIWCNDGFNLQATEIGGVTGSQPGCSFIAIFRILRCQKNVSMYSSIDKHINFNHEKIIGSQFPVAMTTTLINALKYDYFYFVICIWVLNYSRIIYIYISIYIYKLPYNSKNIFAIDRVISKDHTNSLPMKI